MRDLLIYGALFLAWLLFNWISSRTKGARRARRAAEHARSAPTYAAPAPAPVPLDTGWGRAPPPVPEPMPEYLPEYVPVPVPVYVPVAAPVYLPEVAPQRMAQPARGYGQPPRRVRLARRPRLHSPADLRHAIVLTAILGPCRAQQAWEPPDRQA